MAGSDRRLYSEIGLVIGLVGWGGGLLYAFDACRTSCAGNDSLLGVVIAFGFVVFVASFVGLALTDGRGPPPRESL